MDWLRSRFREAKWPLAVQALVAFVALVVVPNALSRSCISLQVSTSIEPGKEEVLEQLAAVYNDGDHEVDGRCVHVEVDGTTSGVAMQALDEGWEGSAPRDGDEQPIPEPQVWTPTSSMWLELLRLRGNVEGLPEDGGWESLTQSVLVVAMPEPMARALGWPDQQVSWGRILELSQAGWSSVGHEEWGDFSFGKDNPHLSTSGLAATVAAFYAAAQGSGLQPGDLEPDDLPGLQRFVQDVEAGVHNYDDDIVDFLRNLARYDAENHPLTYASAVVLQEQLVYQYNTGEYSQDGAEPSEKLVPFYPAESTLLLDHPYVVLPSATAHQEEAARDFFEHLREHQERFAEVGFRDGERVDQLGMLSTEAATMIGGQQEIAPTSLVPPPDGELVQAMLDIWDEIRKPANILLVLDTSSSMRKPTPGGLSRVETMKEAVRRGLEDLLPEAHDVGLWTFPSTSGGAVPADERVPIGPLGEVGDDVDEVIDGLPSAGGGTPLYRTVADAYEQLAQFSRGAPDQDDEINAVVVLTDGGDNDTDDTTDYMLQQLLYDIGPGSPDQRGDPVRIFTIGFSDEADYPVLRQISAETGAQAYDASDPSQLDDIFVEVVNNF